MEEKFCLIAVRAEELAGIANWERVYQETIAPGGMIDKLTKEERREFLKSDQYRATLAIIADLRKDGDSREATKVVTVRMPICIHEALAERAYQLRTSMNQLCLSKLLQAVDDDLVPGHLRSNHSANGSNVKSATTLA